MAWVAIDSNGECVIFASEPERCGDKWCCEDSRFARISESGARTMAGVKLTWQDDPVEIKEVV